MAATLDLIVEQIYYDITEKNREETILWSTFGSSESIDWDFIIWLPKWCLNSLSNPYVGKKLVKLLEPDIARMVNTDKQPNATLGIVDGGIVIWALKGTIDEVNNSIFLTYDYHLDLQPVDSVCPITRVVDRDVNAKILRAVRMLLGEMSRTNRRSDVKGALRKSLKDRLDVLLTINYMTIEFTAHKSNFPRVDKWKTIAFQIGQTLALMDGVEVYSKHTVCDLYPALSVYINRIESVDFLDLQSLKDELVNKINARIELGEIEADAEEVLM